MKFYHRAAALFLALLLTFNLAACDKRPVSQPEQEKESPTQTELPEETKPSERPTEPEKEDEKEEVLVVPEEQSEHQKAFDEFILREFKDSLEGDYLSIHQVLLNPEVYGVDLAEVEVSLGDGIDEAVLEEARTENQKIKEEFELFDYKLLTEEQQETYLLYEYLLENAIMSTAGDFPYMGGAFTPMSGLQGDIVSLLMEYDFHTIADVDAYIDMMRDVPRFVNKMLDFSKVQYEKGYFMSDSACDSTVNYCRKIVKAGEDSALLASIMNNLENCELLTDEQKVQYKEKAKRIFVNDILPAYENIGTVLQSLKDENNNQYGLCYFENGKEYYEYLFRIKSSSERGVEASKKLLQEYLDKSMQNIAMIYTRNKPAYNQYVKGGVQLEYESIGDMLLELEERIWEDFPYIEPVDYSVDYLDPEVAVDGVSAYYVVPPIDSDITQKIKVNPNAGLDLTLTETFATVAHEGLPGHLYQTNYTLQKLDNPFRKTASLLGFSEGYATYTELIAMNYLDDQLEKDLITLDQCYTIFENCLIALSDIGIHYDGWTVADMQDFMDKYVSIEDVKYIYEQLQGDPAGFQAYYMGCVEFLELRRTAQEKLGERFDDMEFHKVILEGGDLPFSVLQDKVDAYIKRAKG